MIIMIKIATALLISTALLINPAAGIDGAGAGGDITGTNIQEGVNNAAMTDVDITIGNRTFAAKFYDNEAAQALMAQMPMTVNMADLNRNEKYYHLSENLPASSTESPETINAGDIMCWSSDSLVLFYETFSNSYSGYVRLGYIEDTSGLASSLGTGNATVTFSVSN